MKISPLVCTANSIVAALPAIVGAVLLIANILLVHQNSRLKVLASRPDRALEVKPGTTLPPLEGIDSNGNKQRINYGQDSRKTVLLVLSPHCRACEESKQNWQAIITGLDRQTFQLAGVSLQSERFKEYASRQGITQIPILTEIDPKYRVAYNLALTPQIMLIDSSGKVEKVWTGLLQGVDKQEVEQALNIRLP
jgi:peroxiredoxin